MTDTTRQRITELRAKGLFAGWSDERVARTINRTAGLHARIATTSAEHGNARQAADATRAHRRMVNRFDLEAV